VFAKLPSRPNAKQNRVLSFPCVPSVPPHPSQNCRNCTVHYVTATTQRPSRISGLESGHFEPLFDRGTVCVPNGCWLQENRCSATTTKACVSRNCKGQQDTCMTSIGCVHYVLHASTYVGATSKGDRYTCTYASCSAMRMQDLISCFVACLISLGGGEQAIGDTSCRTRNLHVRCMRYVQVSKDWTSRTSDVALLARESLTAYCRNSFPMNERDPRSGRKTSSNSIGLKSR